MVCLFRYELVEEIEPRLRIPKSPFNLPTAFASRVNTSIIFDHIDNEILVTSDNKDLLRWYYRYRKGFFKILQENLKLSGTIKILKKGSEHEHQEQVRKCIDYIFRGRFFRQTYQGYGSSNGKKINEIEIYRQLRNKNPSPSQDLLNIKRVI